MEEFWNQFKYKNDFVEDIEYSKMLSCLSEAILRISWQKAVSAVKKALSQEHESVTKFVGYKVDAFHGMVYTVWK